MFNVQPRDYQLEVVSKARRAICEGKKRIIIQGSCGSGKTEVAEWMIHSALEKSPTARILFLAHRRFLVRQTSWRFSRAGLQHGCLMSGCRTTDHRLQIGSKDSLVEWVLKPHLDKKPSRIHLPPPTVIFVDECHSSMSLMYQALLGLWPEATVVGLSASPSLTDGRGMGEYYQSLVCMMSKTEMIRQGWLVPIKVYNPYQVKVKGIRMSANGTYDQKAIDKRINKPKLIGNMIDHWKDFGENRPTILFANSIAHSLHCVERLGKAGIPAVHIDQETSDEDREHAFQSVVEGENKFVCNVGVGMEGVDCPGLSCCVWLVPSGSLIKWTQGPGRIARPYPGKEYAVLLDHAGTSIKLGHPNEDVPWTLNPKEKVQALIKKNQPKEPTYITCPACFLQFKSARVCPGCGHEMKHQPRKYETVGGRLSLWNGQAEGMNEGDRVTVAQANQAILLRIWDTCRAVAANRNGKASAAAVMFHRQTGLWPEQAGMPGVPRGSYCHKPASEMFIEFTPAGKALIAAQRAEAARIEQDMEGLI